jgi:hypothetical protein
VTGVGSSGSDLADATADSIGINAAGRSWSKISVSSSVSGAVASYVKPPSFGEIYMFTASGTAGQAYAHAAGASGALTGYTATGTMDAYGGVSGATASGLLTCVSGGYYHVGYSVSYANDTASENDFWIAKSASAGGYTFVSASNQHVNVASGTTLNAAGQAFVSMSAGDSFQIWNSSLAALTATFFHVNLQAARLG